MDAQYAATTQNIENMKAAAGLTNMRTALEALKVLKAKSQSKYFDQVAESEQKLSKFVALKSKELFYNEQRKGHVMDQLQDLRDTQMDGVKLDNTFKTYRNQLAKQGIYSSDHPLFRQMAAAASRMQISFPDLLAMGWTEIKKHLFD